MVSTAQAPKRKNAPDEAKSLRSTVFYFISGMNTPAIREINGKTVGTAGTAGTTSSGSPSSETAAGLSFWNTLPSNDQLSWGAAPDGVV